MFHPNENDGHKTFRALSIKMGNMIFPMTVLMQRCHDYCCNEMFKDEGSK